MKLVFVITSLSTGGAETMLYRLLKNLDRSRFTPCVISLTSLGEIGPRIDCMGIPVYDLQMQKRWFSLIGGLFRFYRVLRAEKPDLVHTWMYHADLLGGLLARTVGCRSLIWSIRQSNLSPDFNRPLTLLVIRACALLSDWLPRKIVSCSARAQITHGAIGYNKKKFCVIPNGFDLSVFIPNLYARVHVRAELGLSSDTLIIGLIGRFDPQKNHLGFLEAASRVQRAFPTVQFLLAGKDVDESNSVLTEFIEARGLCLNTHLLGRRDDMPKLMAALDILACPSHGEAFPNVVGEAMACGVPCVVTDVGDAAEIVGDTGYVVTAGDMDSFVLGLLSLLSMPRTSRERLGLRAKERIHKKYEIQSVVKTYETLYEQVFCEPRPGKN